MNHDFTEYLPYIVVSLLVVSGVAIVERGDFQKKLEKTSAGPVPVASALPTAPPSPSPSPTPGPTVPPQLQELTAPTPLPVITTKPSINRPRGGDDD